MLYRTALSSITYEPSDNNDAPRRNTDSPLNQRQQKTTQNILDPSLGLNKFQAHHLQQQQQHQQSQQQQQHQLLLQQQSLIPQPQYHKPTKSLTQPPTPQHHYHHSGLNQQQQQQIRKMPSTISTTTTSGLGSQFTNNTSGILSSSLGSHTQPPTPSPRRKISTSSFTENLEYSEQEDNLPLDPHNFTGFHLGGQVNPQGHQNLYGNTQEYIRNGPSFSNDGGAYGAGAHRAGFLGKQMFFTQ